MDRIREICYAVSVAERRYKKGAREARPERENWVGLEMISHAMARLSPYDHVFVHLKQSALCW